MQKAVKQHMLLEQSSSNSDLEHAACHLFGSIEESDGEDALHVFLPPIDPDVLGGDKGLEQAQASRTLSFLLLLNFSPTDC